jgi:phage I-like protein
MEARVAWSRVADALRNARVEVLDHGLRLVPKGRRPPDGTPEAVPRHFL